MKKILISLLFLFVCVSSGCGNFSDEIKGELVVKRGPDGKITDEFNEIRVLILNNIYQSNYYYKFKYSEKTIFKKNENQQLYQAKGEYIINEGNVKSFHYHGTYGFVITHDEIKRAQNYNEEFWKIESSEIASSTIDYYFIQYYQIKENDRIIVDDYIKTKNYSKALEKTVLNNKNVITHLFTSANFVNLFDDKYLFYLDEKDNNKTIYIVENSISQITIKTLFFEDDKLLKIKVYSESAFQSIEMTFKLKYDDYKIKPPKNTDNFDQIYS